MNTNGRIGQRVALGRHCLMLVGMACVAGAGLPLSGCGNSATNTYNEVSTIGTPDGLVIGEQTTVGVRPDVLGASREMPVPAGTEGINGSVISLSGTLHSTGGGWIVLDDAATNKRRWVRLESVNWIHQSIPANPAAGHTGGSGGGHGD